MEPILFYGVPSGCSFGSIVALEWLGRPYRLCRIDMAGDQIRSEAYRQVNPVAETPSLLTSDGRLLSESMAILNHLGLHGIEAGLAFRQGTPEFDRLNQMLAFLNTSLFNAFAPLWHVLERGIADSDRQVLRAYGAEWLAKVHADLDRTLRDQEWLLGDRRTLADAYFAGIARWTRYHDVLDRGDYPNVQRLFEKLEHDPAVRFAHDIEAGNPRRGGGGFRGQVDLDIVLGQLQQAA